MLAKLWYRKILLGEKAVDDVPKGLKASVEKLIAENTVSEE